MKIKNEQEDQSGQDHNMIKEEQKKQQGMEDVEGVGQEEPKDENNETENKKKDSKRFMVLEQGRPKGWEIFSLIENFMAEDTKMFRIARKEF